MPKSKPKEPSPPPLKTVKMMIEYENMDAMNPKHADGMLGVVTPSGDLHLTFYSEFWLPAERLETELPVTQTGPTTFTASGKGPEEMLSFNSDSVRVRRNIECSIVVKASTLRPWPAFLSQKLKEVENQLKSNEQ